MVSKILQLKRAAIVDAKGRKVELSMNNDLKICVVGLGYVGLPLLHALAQKFNVVGYDVSNQRVDKLSIGVDTTNELNEAEMSDLKKITISADPSILLDANVYIVTVPTPVDKYSVPDLSPLKSATETIARYLRKSDCVIYESTVYPGATEEVCVPILEVESNLRLNEDFIVGYSPERINPGDKTRKFSQILKVVSGSNDAATSFVQKIYSEVVHAGTYSASSIKVAEAAKVIENTQRDINIALINELARLFDELSIDTYDVLAAAGTKWNFIPFEPGLVGGHCIGVDPYYLLHKAKEVGFNPEMIVAGRRTNDSMHIFMAQKLIKFLTKNYKKPLHDIKILNLGLSFKENCPDLRNTKVLDFVKELRSWGVNVDVHDPVCITEEAKEFYNETLISSADLSLEEYDVLVLAVPHDDFIRNDGEFFNRRLPDNTIIFDIKSKLKDKKYSNILYL